MICPAVLVDVVEDTLPQRLRATTVVVSAAAPASERNVTEDALFFAIAGICEVVRLDVMSVSASAPLE